MLRFLFKSGEKLTFTSEIRCESIKGNPVLSIEIKSGAAPAAVSRSSKGYAYPKPLFVQKARWEGAITASQKTYLVSFVDSMLRG